MLKHRGKEKIKAQFTVTFHGIKKLEKSLNGSTVYIEWKRSSKPGCNGITKRALVSNGDANWPAEPVTFAASFYKEAKSEKLDKKLLQVTLMEVFFFSVTITNDSTDSTLFESPNQW